VAAAAELGAALSLEGQAGGVHEYHAELGKQVSPAGEQLFLDEILATARRQGAGPALIGQRLAEPGHSTVEMMQLQPLGAVDAVVGTPLFRRSVGARHKQAVQHGQEHRALGGKGELSLCGQGRQYRLAAGLLPQPFEQQRRTDPSARRIRRDFALLHRQHHRALRQPGDRARQAVEIAVREDHLLASEIGDDALFGAAALTHILDQIDVGVAADALVADKHAVSIAIFTLESTM
jgi:hypothetical protein